jgi:hypothetical protein
MVSMTAPKLPEDQHEEADPHEAAPTTIQRLWTQVDELRQRHNQERLKQGKEPIQNKEIATATDIPASTLSDWLNNKKNFVPEWDKFSRIIECFDGTTKEWVKRWQNARAAYDSMRMKKPGRKPDAERLVDPEVKATEIWRYAAPPSAPSSNNGDVVGPSAQAAWYQRIRLPSRRKTLILSGAVIVIVVAVSVFGLVKLLSDDPKPGFDPDTQPATGTTDSRCLRVKDETETVSVFKDPNGYDRWTQWPAKTMFRAEVDRDNQNRYRVRLQNGKFGYVNKDGRYIVSSSKCS